MRITTELTLFIMAAEMTRMVSWRKTSGPWRRRCGPES
jgi:hypothetical protein